MNLIKYSLAALLFLTINACKKEAPPEAEYYTIQGTVTDGIGQVSNAMVDVYIMPGLPDKSITPTLQVGSTFTDASGHYSCTFAVDKQKRPGYVYVSPAKDGHFGSEYLYGNNPNPNYLPLGNMQPGIAYTYDPPLYRKANISVALGSGVADSLVEATVRLAFGKADTYTTTAWRQGWVYNTRLVAGDMPVVILWDSAMSKNGYYADISGSDTITIGAGQTYNYVIRP